MGLMSNLRKSDDLEFINSIFPRCYLIHAEETDSKTKKITKGSEHELLYADFEVLLCLLIIVFLLLLLCLFICFYCIYMVFVYFILFYFREKECIGKIRNV